MNAVLNAEILVDKLDKISKITLTQALNKAAIVVENDAKVNCPVDTGTLRNSITHIVDGNQAQIGTNIEYAPFIEYGTGIFRADGTGRQTRWSFQSSDGTWHSTLGQKPQPFLEPALKNNRDRIIEVLEEEIKKGLQNA